MSVQLLKRVTCDLCRKASNVSQLTDYYDRSVPKGWVKLSYELEDYNGMKYSSGEFDICECCLAREDGRIEFYPCEMIREATGE